MPREPLIKSSAVATAAFRDGMREARRSQWPFPLASRATKQTARKGAPDSVSRSVVREGAQAAARNAVKRGAHAAAPALKEPLIKSIACATVCYPGAGQGVRSAVWLMPNKRRTIKPCARIVPSLRVAAIGRPSAVLLGLALLLSSAAPSRLASGRPSPATRRARGLIGGSFTLTAQIPTMKVLSKR